jgi:WD40 repeat protein
MYAVTLDNRLIHFVSDAPGNLLTEVQVAGLPSGERLVSIDIRPSDGQIYGVGTDDQVYRLDNITGNATAVGSPFTPTLGGEHFGLVITSSDDRIRTSSSETEENLRFDPATGALLGADANFAYASGDVNAGTNPSVAALAVSGSTLYGIESNEDVLVRVSNPATGELTTVGSFGSNTVPCAAFDIDGSDGVAFASLATNGISRLYTINLGTGAATLIGVIDVDSEVQGLAVATAGALVSGL